MTFPFYWLWWRCSNFWSHNFRQCNGARVPFVSRLSRLRDDQSQLAPFASCSRQLQQPQNRNNDICFSQLTLSPRKPLWFIYMWEKFWWNCGFLVNLISVALPTKENKLNVWAPCCVFLMRKFVTTSKNRSKAWTVWRTAYSLGCCRKPIHNPRADLSDKWDS